MIIIDMNQIMISNLMAQLKSDRLNEKLVRHMVLNSLRSYEQKYGEKYGEMVLAYDSKQYWRKQVFPYYKQNRKKDRQRSGHDWSSIFEVLNKIRDEIKEYFPYKVVEVLGAEADDVISTLCKNKGPKELILILSGDKDFIQLHKYPGVYQYNPIAKKNMGFDDPHLFIKEHIIKGDKSDGIPNFLSADDCFVKGERQRPISQKNLAKWVDMEPSSFCMNDTQLANYHRNRLLIDFDYVPKEIEQQILDEFNSLNIDGKQVPLEYFQQHQLNDLMQEYFFRSSTPFKK
ncbi:ribonuclease Rnh [Cyanophage S-RIM44]|uniref:Ribonuclease n=2 Tax=Vellamovirus TaxID=2733139 RepID=A0A127KMZ1_9CAUD|nr:Rnh RNaseH [Prochlorococcus phage Syn1]AMO43462.1 ribonuclease [Cyanophage S-RIM44]ADO99323.1 Rnh RNaseH [Prochlorococcus phage Syn1]AOO11934.1 ribonuclease Rnh [Cyanophage S-RIM44]AOO12168.1 ribonuclease Rnh [Cyanophage S-RIM44]AOO12635.1 ribonuclease Rnh [Cyanophage S-RIM44]